MFRGTIMKNAFFNIGPFGKVEERIEDFSSGLYLQKLYNETITELIETQEAYDNAVKESDDVVATSLRTQLEFLESVVMLANNNIISYTSDTMYYD